MGVTVITLVALARLGNASLEHIYTYLYVVSNSQVFKMEGTLVEKTTTNVLMHWKPDLVTTI